MPQVNLSEELKQMEDLQHLLKSKGEDFTIGQRIKYVRLQRYETQELFAKKAGITPSALKKIELDKSKNFGIEHLAKIAKITGKSADYYLGIAEHKETTVDDMCIYTGLSLPTIEELHNNVDDNLYNVIYDVLISEGIISELIRFTRNYYQYILLSQMQSKDGTVNQAIETTLQNTATNVKYKNIEFLNEQLQNAVAALDRCLSADYKKEIQGKADDKISDEDTRNGIEKIKYIIEHLPFFTEYEQRQNKESED